MKKLILLLPLFMIACTSSQEAGFEKSTGKTNKVKTGSRFYINLAEDHKVGSGLWSIQHDYDEKVISYLSSVYNASDGGSVNFNFETVAKGKTEVHLLQSFAGDTIQVSTFVVEVE